jgi:hypothetical protein
MQWDVLEVCRRIVVVADGEALLSGFWDACVRRGRGEGLERRVTVDPWIVCESSSLADEDTLIESGGVEEPCEESVDL